MKNKLTVVSVLIFFLCQITMNLQAQQMNKMWGSGDKDTAKQSTKRGRFFADGNYCMFIHWGLYSHIANKWDGKTFYGIGEWIMNRQMADIQVDEYKSIAKEFNPVEFDAHEIARLAKDAGMKYIIITSKHHDGFAMFHSTTNKFNIVDATPFGRDPMKELSDACHELGLGFGFYYSHNQDWTYPGGAGGPRVDHEGNKKTFDDYFVEKCLPQVEEITKNYGEIELIWFDTPGNMPKKYAQQLVEVVHRNQPVTLVAGRVGYDLGDYQTLGDMEVPLENIEGLWEGIDVTNDSWGYAWYDENWKTPKQVLTTLIATVARGGTFMLNVGPDGLGRIPEPAKQTLRSAGKWIAKYPQVVYGTDASPWNHALPWGDVVVKENKMYLAVYDWPATGELWLPGLQTQIEGVNLMDDTKKYKKLTFSKNGDWTCINIPFQAPDKMISIIEVILKDIPKVDSTMGVDPEIGINIPVLFAQTENCIVNYKDWMEKFGEWKHAHNVNDWKPNSTVTFEFNVKETGTYHVDLTYSGQGRLVWGVTTDEGYTIRNQQNSSHIYTKYPIGWVKFDKSGKHTITVKLIEGDFNNASLTSISLTPVDFNY
jgi:alpha-L-fucosidase